MISLHSIAPQRLQPRRFCGRFDAFGDGEHIKLFVDCDQRLLDYLIVWIKGVIANKMPVNFKYVKVELLKWAKSRLSNAKIIQCKADTFALQIAHKGGHQFGHHNC